LILQYAAISNLRRFREVGANGNKAQNRENILKD